MGGTGSFACQLAKHTFQAGKVITTVSTSKIPKVKELLGEDTVDESKALLAIWGTSLGVKIAHLVFSSYRLHQSQSRKCYSSRHN